MGMTALRQLREAAGVPRIVLADRAGVSPFRLYQGEAGRCDLTASERARIDRVLGPELDKVVRTATEFGRRQQGAIGA
jgi:helix-turn-helix protein